MANNMNPNRHIRALYARLNALQATAEEIQAQIDALPHIWVPGEDLDLDGGIIKDTGSTGYVEFEPTWDDIRVASTAVKIGSLKPPRFAQTVGNCWEYIFDNGVLQQVFFTCQLPHAYVEGSDLRPHIHWYTDAGHTAGDVYWGLEYFWMNVDDAIPGSTTTIYTAATTSATWVHEAHSFPTISGTGKNVSSMLVCRLFRDGANVLDTNTADAVFLEFDFHYQKNSLGSDEEFTKN